MPDDPMLEEFKADAGRLLDQSEQLLLELERNPADRDLVDGCFRALHSVKGNAGFFGLQGVVSLAHSCEGLLDTVREGHQEMSPQIGDLLLQAVDALREELAAPGAQNNDHLIATLNGARVAPEPDPLVPPAAEEYELLISADLDRLHMHIECAEVGIRAGLEKVGHIIASDPIPPDGLDQGSGPCQITIRTPLDAAIVAELYGLDEDAVLLRPCEDDQKPPAAAPSADDDGPAPDVRSGGPPPSKPQGSPPTSERQQRDGSEDASVRVSTRFLDDLLTFTGNMVMARNQLLTKFAAFQDELAFATLSRCITDVHRSVVQQRMQPVGDLFERFRRVVRDLARSLDKRIDLQVDGGDIELDRSILEAFADPLTHLVRNAVDHAIETPAAREAAGKNARGVVRLSASNQSGELLISVEDDGAGIDPQRVLAKAIERDLVDQQQAQQLDTDDIVMLIFAPGFSTRDEASDVSGRGVGMDVVKTNIEAIGGIIEVHSQVGRGTRFTFRLPLAQSIVSSSLISALVVRAGGQRFALAESAVNEIIRVDPQSSNDHIKTLDGHDVYQLRDTVLSIVHLEDAVGLPRTYLDPATGELKADRRERIPDRRQGEDPAQTARWAEQRSGIERRHSKQTLVVVEFRHSLFGLMVDQVDGIEEVVVRASPVLIDTVPVFKGHTVLGDGSVVMMCDVAGIVEAMGLRFTERAASVIDTRGALKTAQQMVVFDYAPNEFFAIPLMMTGLIEVIDTADIKRVGSREFYQLKDQTIPLLHLEDHLDVSSRRGQGRHHLILPARMHAPIGIIAGMNLSVEDFSENFDGSIDAGHGVVGTAFRDDRLIMLLDLYALCEHAMPEQFAGDHDHLHTQEARLLLAEDNRFFTRLVTGYLAQPGIDLVCVEDGQAAWELLQEDQDFSLIISDIEMPRMNGFELVKRIRADHRFDGIPVVALTSLADEGSRQRGLKAGFERYAVKIDKEELLAMIDEMVTLPKQAAMQ